MNHPASVPSAHAAHPIHTDKLARFALFGFVVTFIIARACVFLIMSKRMPNLYFFLHGTHVHHLNYGIFLLAAVAGYSVFRRPVGRAAELVALLYGISMALTFDEFGMWLHLGGSYWQRASIDAVVIITALLLLFGFARSIRKFEAHHLRAFIILTIAIAGFIWVVLAAGNQLGDLVGPALHDLEVSSSP